jgi:probable HAF family extracellular repeat protein
MVGGGAFPNRVFDAYLWRNGVATDLGTLDGDCGSEADAINSKGQVIGTSFPCDGGTRTFLWEDGSMIDLNALVPPGSGLQFVDVTAINDPGEIAGTEVPPSCKGGPTPARGNDAACGHAYVLIPCNGEHFNDEGCEDSAETITVARSVPFVQRSPTAAQAASQPRIAARVHSRLGRNRGFRAAVQK